MNSRFFGTRGLQMQEFSTRSDMQGRRFARLTAVEFVETRNRLAFWRFHCDCGAEKVINGSNVRSGKTTSCGCHHRKMAKTAKTTHGKSGTAEHSVWSGMKQRCLNPNSTFYKRYGGRGIGICDRWLDFQSFLLDMGPRPSPQHTIERLENDKGYAPGNCVWLVRKQQSQNRAVVRRYEFRGSRLTIRQLSEQYAIPVKSLTRRIEAGWEISRAVLEPLAAKGSRV